MSRSVIAQKALYGLIDRMHATESAAKVCEAALEAMYQAMGCQGAALLLIDDAQAMRSVAQRGVSERYLLSIGERPGRLSLDVAPAPFLVSNVDELAGAEWLKHLARSEAIRALAFVPVVSDGVQLGEFALSYEAPHDFTEGEIQFAEVVARLLTLGLSRQRADHARRVAEARLLRERELLQTIIDQAPMMITMYEPDTTLLRVNPEFQRVTGWSTTEAAGVSLMEACYPDPELRGRVTRHMEGEGGRWLDIPMRARNGRDVEASWANLRLSDGTRIGIGLDITERKRSQGAEALLAAIVRSSDDAIVGKNVNGVILSWNRGAERLFGYRTDEAVGRPIRIIIPPERQDEEDDILARIRGGQSIDHYETIRRRKDGSLVEVSLTVSPILNDKGEVVGASKVARDITERRKAERQRALLIAELNHRVKNTLATVISIARQSFANPNLAEAQRAFDARIRGLAQTHNRLAESNWSSVSLQTLLEDELSPYRHDDGANIRVAGPPVALSPKSALTLGLAIHELATNAAKHGALSIRTGVVDASWAVEPVNGTLLFHWRETEGPRVTPPSRSGFGRLLIERVVTSDLRSTVQLEFADKGVCCAIAVPRAEYLAETC